MDFPELYQRKLKELLKRGATNEEIEREMDALVDRTNRYTWAVEHPGDIPLALAGDRQ